MLVVRRVSFVILFSSILAQDVLSSYVPRQRLPDDFSILIRRDRQDSEKLFGNGFHDPRSTKGPPHEIAQPSIPSSTKVNTPLFTYPVEVKQAEHLSVEAKPQTLKSLKAKRHRMKAKPRKWLVRAPGTQRKPRSARGQPRPLKFKPPLKMIEPKATKVEPQPTKGKLQALKKKPRPVKISRPVKVKLPRTKVGSQPSTVPPQSTRTQQQLTKVPKAKSRMGKGKAGAISAAVLGAGALIAGGTAFAHDKGLFKREHGPVSDYVEQETTNPLLHSSDERVAEAPLIPFYCEDRSSIQIGREGPC